jgi:hypothetical protein
LPDTAKIKFKRVAHFYSRGNVVQHTTFTTHSTTISPQKHHHQLSIFLKNPCKITNPPQQLKGASPPQNRAAGGD